MHHIDLETPPLCAVARILRQDAIFASTAFVVVIKNEHINLIIYVPSFDDLYGQL